jgi:hypothetical protein
VSGVFDPYAVFRELERERMFYVVVGGLARVLHGSDETTHGVDIAPALSDRNLSKIQGALERLNGTRRDGHPLDLTGLDADREPLIEFNTDAGEVKLVLQPAGTRGYEDLRHRANRESIGEGLRPEVASPADLIRMHEALARELGPHARGHDPLVIDTLRHVMERDRGLGWER